MIDCVIDRKKGETEIQTKKRWSLDILFRLDSVTEW